MQKSFTADCPFSCSVSACFPGTYGDSCSGPCPNQHYGKNKNVIVGLMKNAILYMAVLVVRIVFTNPVVLLFLIA